MSNYTRGKWKAKGGVVEADGIRIATVNYKYIHPSQHKANQILIAAAPDLLKAAIDALHSIRIMNGVLVSNGIEPQGTIILELEEAIKRATE